MINEGMETEADLSMEGINVGAVIMDMQANLLGSIGSRENLKDSMILQIKIFKALNIPLCLTEQVPSKLGSTVPEISSTCAGDPVFDKNTFSAFGSSEFNNWIKSNSLKHLLVSGIETPICIYQTCIDALRLNIKVTLVSDCIGARRQADGETTLAQLRSFGCCLIPLEAITYSLLSNSTHEQFRNISGLIRERD